MSEAIYGFEAKGIQAYVMDGGRLADMAVASALIDRLILDGGGDAVDACLEDSKASGLTFLRRAGGALIARGPRGALKDFRRVFTFNVLRRLPGLAFVDGLTQGGRDLHREMEELRGLMEASRNRPSPVLPMMAPGGERAPRSGRPAISWDNRRKELVDEATQAVRAGTRKEREARAKTFAARVLGPGRESETFPIEFDADPDKPQDGFPFVGDNRTIAIVHADGNGLGAGVMKLLSAAGEASAAAAALKALSTAVAAATQAAVQSAFDTIRPVDREDEDGAIHRVLPARPVLVGGDDVTMILRGDRALAWTLAFLRDFRADTKRLIADGVADLKTAGKADAAGLLENHFGDGLSAGAGIAYANAGMPFDQLYGVCESLASHAKSAAKSFARHNTAPVAPSYVSLHRITASALDRYGDIVDNELRLDGDRVLSANPYSAQGGDAPPADALIALADRFASREFPTGPLREWAGTIGVDPVGAKDLWDRFVAVARRKGHWDVFAEKLAAAAPGWDGKAEPFDAKGRTPVFDALSLNAAGGAS